MKKKTGKEVSSKAVRIYEEQGLEAAIAHIQGAGFRTALCPNTSTQSEKDRCQ